MQLSRFGLRASRLPLRPVARSASVYWNGMQRNSISCPQHRWFSTAPRSVSISVMEGGVENSFSTEDQRVIDLSLHVRNNDLLASLRAYSELPLFLPRSDFRIVCSLMHTLGKRCHVPDLENAFFKIQKMKLTRKHAVTFRCLIRLACELHDTNLIESFYQSICEEETYINNAFLNDIMVDSLFSLDAYASLCNVFDSMHILLDNGQLLPSFNNHSGQSALTAFIAEGRDDLVVFFLEHIKQSWRIPVVFTDYIISNATRYRPYIKLFDKCIESQPKSATILNSVIQFYIQDGSVEEAMRYVEQAVEKEVKVTSVSYKELCKALVECRVDNVHVDEDQVRTFCGRICCLSRGGYIVMLGLTPLEMMLKYGEIDHAIRYVDLLRQYENGLTRRDVLLLEEMQTEVAGTVDLYNTIGKLIALLKEKYSS